MATATTGWKCTHQATIINDQPTYAEIQVRVYWQNDGWTYQVGNISANARCDGRTVAVLTNGSVNTSDGISGNSADLYWSQELGDGYVFTVNKTESVQYISCQGQIISNNSYCGTGTRNSTATTVTVSAKTHYTIIYDYNDGTGNTSSVTKWYDTPIYMPAAPTRYGYTFYRWRSTANDQLYSAGQEYGHNNTDTIVAQWTPNTYKITYNANGGEGGPTEESKTYGAEYTISTSVPSRDRYNFKGWATSASATTATYQPGDTYSTNAGLDLYAVWEVAYIKPRIDELEVYRCDQNGVASDAGTYVKVRFVLSTDEAITDISVSYTPTGGTPTIIQYQDLNDVKADKHIVDLDPIGDGEISTDLSYSISISVTDTVDGSTVTRTIPSRVCIIDGVYDSSTGEVGVALGKSAEETGIVDVPLLMKTGQGIKNVQNGVTTEIGSNNEYYTHLNTDAPSGFYFGNQIQVNGDICQYRTPENGGLRPVMYRDQLGYFRFAGGWIGMYPSTADADAWTNRLGWFGFDNSTDTWRMNNEVIGGATQIYANDRIYIWSDRLVEIAGGGGSCYFVSDRFRPNSDDKLYLGDSGNHWKAVYAVNGTIQTSDRNQKEDIEELDPRYIELFKKLTPVSFKFKGGEHDRVHVGFISQDVKAAMDEVGLTDEDFAGYCRDVKTEYNKETGESTPVLDENGDLIYNYSLRYSEFIALNTRMIQELQTENCILKYKMADLEQRLAALEEKITS